jgi:hypothetical protein
LFILIQPDVWCGSWSFPLKEEERWRVFVQWRTFEPKRDEVTGDWRKLHSEEVYNL